MSDTGTFKSGHTDDFTNGLNPMYQSLSVTTHQEQTEYDVINDSQSCLIKPPLPTRVTTCNSLYSSRSEASTIKHPTLNSNPGDFRFVPIPEISRFEEEKERPRCPCSCTAILCVVTLFNILLSVAAIALCLLLWLNVISSFPVATSSSSSPSSSQPSDPANNSNSTPLCNCTAFTHNFSNLSFNAFEDIHQSLLNISLEMRDDFDSSKLASLFTRVASLSDSIQQLEVKVTNTCSALSQQHSIIEPVELDELGNQTCPPNVTELNQPADVTIDFNDQCIVQGGQVCTVNPGTFCLTPTITAFNEDNKALMDFSCYVTFMDGSTGTPNATAVVREDTIVDTSPDQDITSTVLSTTMQTLGCQCFSFEDTAKLSCRHFSRHCNSTKGTVESVINILS